MGGGTHGTPIVVLGAGVVGLTTALTLARQGYKDIRVIAKHMPSDQDVEYCSRWAGADWDPISDEGSREAGWDTVTWHELLKLAQTRPGSGVREQVATKYYRKVDRKPEGLKNWYKDLVSGYKFLSKDQVPAFADWGVTYRSLSLDPDTYLHWLYSSCLDEGVLFQRATLSHIREALQLTPTPPVVVVNCTGLGSLTLGGVEDAALRPVQGQLVIVANELAGSYAISGSQDFDSSIGECCYVITRGPGAGAVLGGCRNPSWAAQPDMSLAERIMKRAVQVAPGIVEAGEGVEALRVVRHQIGWRPHRDGGPRVETETIEDEALGPIKVVHAYGMDGFGFQSSYGVAGLVAELVAQSVA
ncbi:Uu.00g044690.m01.CDS01 [Anthostomella pinea]|uniref:Uu.00g044690.m01.CDS01 n=1 Tax=Anthostomella pinea TaxID=933095 RepID=A0AAI8YE89_9PEZI|nr:Uu.00g044690.m01.CDS01 [Anthostomella pinea]